MKQNLKCDILSILWISMNVLSGSRFYPPKMRYSNFIKSLCALNSFKITCVKRLFMNQIKFLCLFPYTC